MVSYAGLRARLEKLLKLEISGETSESRIFEIPVCYGGEYGPDLQNIADHAGLTPDEVIKIHSAKDYLIYMLGFLPGFSYLGGLDDRIHTPRLANPRIRIPAGSVGDRRFTDRHLSAGFSGGWQLLGMTPVKNVRSGERGADPFRGGRLYPFCPRIGGGISGNKETGG